MRNKIRDVVRKVYDNGRRLENLERCYAELDKLQRENYWANIFNTTITGTSWLKDVSFNVGRWAPSYVLFYVLYRILNEVKPMNILELGMGETTKMIQKYKEALNPNAFCVTVEHDKEWIELKRDNGISLDLINVVNAELGEISVNGRNTKQYINLPERLSSFSKKFNLFLIDGPFGSENYSRYNIVELIMNNFLENEFIIIMDDYNRKGEKDTIDEMKKLLTGKGIDFGEAAYRGDKEFYILVSPKYRYLLSL